ncbi:MAG: Glycosyl transferase, WecB/TagA/CpsF family [Candidatus Moranbacteria bacterium GW2011_GWC2_37_73]|nr:MAG: glycosyl transferase, WecB/TagA/CpsF family, N-acetylglucosaminyldiphosphoundecaprenol [Parcubacteria group bacterium GW2011_GWC1_36_108]KKQ01246.1 MAG: Glycosyl transferase, WecB/TagA/CpsF family [Candidatus Moranbacteria bacterium GW2011_GWD1_36_198]KKQ02305.1 MAG: Glycosyl transferase, WecB/TagA/CpsF family [Candidatus Moranbacteria bacterium GW2011_GWD2_36_198]KKQ40200.1 MAG: Glycosyl transferase, WecB/TagA/CpsF family [Candidatus Moranbacteria bacterium GW2011_GWC2_37_73]HAR99702.1
MQILGVRIDNFSKKEILEKIEFFLNEENLHQIATVNPEFILRAQKDLEFKNILNKSDLNVADGVGIWYAFLRYGGRLKNRIAGVDLMDMILKMADEKNLSLFLAIHKNGLSSFDEIKKVLNEKYPNIEVFGGDIDSRRNKKIIPNVDQTLVLCNFGFPAQEKFINLLKNKQNSSLQLNSCRGKIRLAIGVGGSFDFVTGKISRAPHWMQKIGLEWLWRFAQEPKYRFKRIINAVIVFPIRVLFNK